jgi:putative endonuclease
MAYYVYILESESDGMLYVGFTENLKRRYAEHLSGTGCRTTGMKNDWKLIYFEGYPNKSDALGREKFLKSGSGRRYIFKQLTNHFKTKTT